MKRKLLSFSFVLLLPAMLAAQPAADKQINPYHKRYADSLKAMDYKPPFPLLGRKAYKRGYDIPLPYGVGTTFMSIKQDITIANTQIGFNGGEPIDLSNVITYGNVVNKTNMVTVRPDIWVLPFLNVYGLVGLGNSQVEVPISAIAGEPLDFSTTQQFEVRSTGFGATVAGGFGPVFIVLDNNVNWAKTPLVEKSIPAYTIDARIGHNFISARHPERSLTVWAGAFMMTLQSSTTGHIALNDVISTEKVTDLKTRIDNSHLPQRSKDKITDALDNFVNTTVDYRLDKKVAAPWNMIFGAQYQYNKHWQGRVELGTFGRRTQFLVNLNYRFQ